MDQTVRLGKARKEPARWKPEPTDSRQNRFLRLLTLDPHSGHAAPPRGSQVDRQARETSTSLRPVTPLLPHKSILQAREEVVCVSVT